MKRIVITFCILYGLIYIAHRMIANSLNGINTQKSLITVGEQENTKNTKNKNRADHKKGSDCMTPEERYAEAKKILDLKELKRKYGISTTPRRYGPASAEEWQKHIEANIVTPQFLSKPQTQKIMSTMQVSEEDYEKQTEDIQKRINEAKSQLAEDPLNKAHSQNLQNLYRLQAVSNAIKSAIVVKESAFDGLTTDEAPPSPSSESE